MKSVLPPLSAWTKYLEIAYQNSKFSNFGEVSHLVESRVGNVLGISSELVVACANATLGLTGAVATSTTNSYPWTIPSWTFTATASAMHGAGKEFFFSDIDKNWRIRPSFESVNIIDVLPFGDDIDIDRLENIGAGEIVIDAAASFDALRFSKIDLIKRRFGLVVSFHPTKFPPGPEGAVFISNDPDWCRRFRLWSIFGMDESRESNFPGTNAKINEFSSAVILASLDYYEQNRDNLRTSLKLAQDLSREIGLEVIEPIKKGYAIPYWIIKADKARINLVEIQFRSRFIDTRRWWMFGCHRMKAYGSVPKEDLPMTNLAAETSLGLPMYIGMSDHDWGKISDTMREAI